MVHVTVGDKIRSVYTAPNGTVVTCEGVVDQIGFGRLLYDRRGTGPGPGPGGPVCPCARRTGGLGPGCLLAGGKTRCHADAIRAQKAMLQ